MNIYFHIAPGNVLDSILTHGLIPKIGERYYRYSKIRNIEAENSIHVCKSLELALELSGYSKWNTHPDFVFSGQCLIRVKTNEIGIQDPAYHGGLLLKNNIEPKYLKLIKKI